jgi:hypothetical protein
LLACGVDQRDALLDDARHARGLAGAQEAGYPLPPHLVVQGEVGASAVVAQGGCEIESDIAPLQALREGRLVEDVRGVDAGAAIPRLARRLRCAHERANAESARGKPWEKMSAIDATRPENCDARFHAASLKEVSSLVERMEASSSHPWR